MGLFDKLKNAFGSKGPNLQDYRTFVDVFMLQLPAEYEDIRTNTLSYEMTGISESSFRNGFKFIEYQELKAKSKELSKAPDTFLLQGMQIYSHLSQQYAAVELLVNKGILWAFYIQNSSYSLKEYDFKRINSDLLKRKELEFPKTEVDEFYEQLPKELREKLDPKSMWVVNVGMLTFYGFYKMGAGNFLALNMDAEVFSFVERAQPILYKMSQHPLSLLNQIGNGQFDSASHIEMRLQGLE